MAVASDSECSSKVGKSILDKGGSVVDASIASLLCNGVLNAQSMGIGGGLFLLHYDRKNEKMTVIDARETAPQNSDMNMFKSSSKTKGGLSIAVPGEIKGYWQAHQMFGKLKWSELFQPAIEMCNNGFCMPQSQARILKYCESKIMSCDALRETFCNKITNDLYKANNIVKRPKLAKTLEIIAKEGESAFYNGSLTQTIVDEIQSGGGIINKYDLNTYKCEIKEPVSYKLRNNVELFTVPSPSCGVLLNFILGLLDSKRNFLEK
jgi:gamma-glutamyltranspeptidase/glutathione hydrolase/leukotriene-C4 hydrolase